MHKITKHNVNGTIVKVWHPNEKHDVPCFQISIDSGGWLIGSYDSIESAILGANCNLMMNESFYKMQKRVNHDDRENRLIMMDDFDCLEDEK